MSMYDPLHTLLLVAIGGLVLVCPICERRSKASECLSALLEWWFAAALERARYYIPPAQRAAIEGSILAVLGSGVEPGVAFFVSPTKALTAAHHLQAFGSRHLRVVTCVRTSDSARLTFDVLHCDTALGCAVLQLRQGQPPSQHFLTVPRAIGVAEGERDLFLVACNIRMAAGALQVASVGIAWHCARLVRLQPHSFLYDSPPFDGDTGGAIVVASTGAVIGLHRELVSAARERTGAGGRLQAEEHSWASLIQEASVGCVAVRTDSEGVRRMLGVETRGWQARLWG
jgi:hypothetical protein